MLSKSQSALGVECRGIPALTLSDSNSRDVPNARSKQVIDTIRLDNGAGSEKTKRGCNRIGLPTRINVYVNSVCPLYTSDAADDENSVAFCCCRSVNS